MHQCPIDRCLTEVPDDWLMCTAHWNRVSVFRQRRVMQTRLRRANSAAALRQYKAACRAAVNSVESSVPAMAIAAS